MLRISTVLFISTILLISCNNTNNSNNTVTLEQISSLEKELFSSENLSLDMAKAKHLAELYIEFAKTHPQDQLSPEFLYKASDIYMNLNYPKQALALYDNILTKYPSYKNNPTIMFLKGFVYDDQLKDYDNARVCYENFLEKYPESEFADDAIISLNNLGKSPEEMIKEFELKNNE